MIRTALSVCALSGALFFVTKAWNESTAADGKASSRRPAARTIAAQDDAPAADAANEKETNNAGLQEPAEFAAAANCGDETPPVSASSDAERAANVEQAAKEDQAGEDRVPVGTTLAIESPMTETPEAAKPDESDDMSPPEAPDENPEKKSEDDQPSSPLTPEEEALRDKVRRCLMLHYHDPITTSDHTPWGVMHVLIAYGVDTEIIAGNRRVSAIGWLCYNGSCRGMKMLYVENGKPRVRIGPGVQGHPGQFLAMLAQSRVRTDYPIKIDGRDFTVADLIESEKETCRAKTELTFKLIAMAHYLKPDATWKSDIGEEWNIPRLIKEELAQPVVGAACGGTHRMTGHSYAVNKLKKAGLPFEGQWLRGQKFVEAYHDYIFRLQNQDGSFSSNWFAGRGDWGDDKRVVETTGHMLEWLVCSLPKEQLNDPRVVKAVERLTDALMDGRKNRVQYPVGPRGHGLHALAMYNERRFGDLPGDRDLVLGKRPSSPAEGVRTAEGPAKSTKPAGTKSR